MKKYLVNEEIILMLMIKYEGQKKAKISEQNLPFAKTEMWYKNRSNKGENFWAKFTLLSNLNYFSILEIYSRSWWFFLNNIFKIHIKKNIYQNEKKFATSFLNISICFEKMHFSRYV